MPLDAIKNPTTNEAHAPKHFEVEYRVLDHWFTYKCTTAYEALDAIAAIRAHRPGQILVDMDEMMENLIKIKNGDALYYQNNTFAIRYVDGEV